MFLCSNSSAVGLWLSRLRKKSRKSFWTISYPPWVINLPGPGRRMRRSEWRELLPHPVRCETDSDHRRLLGSSISTPGKAPGVTSRQADPPPSSHPRPLPSPCSSGASGASGPVDASGHRGPFLSGGLLASGSVASASPAPKPQGKSSLLAMFVQNQGGHKEVHGPGETRDSEACPRTIDALLLVPTHPHQSCLRRGRTKEQEHKGYSQGRQVVGPQQVRHHSRGVPGP